MQHSRPKVFFIGFNKTATTAFHRLFTDSGYRSIHHSARFEKKRKYLGDIIRKNKKSNLPLLKSIENYDAYSEMLFCTPSVYYDAIKDYKLLHTQYKDGYFILQTRNLDNWIKSRFNHKRNQNTFYAKAKHALSMDNAQLEEYWRKEYFDHHNEVNNYFSNNSKFLTFNIDEDNIIKLLHFLKLDYDLKINNWKKYNVTSNK